MPISTVIASAKAGELIFAGIYNAAVGHVKERLKRVRSVNKINSIYRKLNSVRRVKTIWQIEREVDLLTFYYPSRVLSQKGRKEIRSVKDFEYDGNIVVEGTVGQGKSIFLRHLCTHELYVGQIIPVFVELRRLETGTTLVSYLCATLDALGIGDDVEVFEYLASTGKLVLCLDGFDEVTDAEKPGLIRQIEHLTSKHEELRIIVTSRPDTGIEKSPFFRVQKLAPLTRNDVRNIIDKLVHDAPLSDEIVKAVEKAKTSIREMLTTPLMVTLLVIAYKAHQKVPETLAEFYESLFNTLLLRHDKLKAGFNRTRRSGLHDRAIREVFDATCFLCRKQQLTTIPQEELYDIVKKAANIAQLPCEPHLFIDDIKHITCLMLEEGGKYHFIHKSVSEYHSASFVRRRPELAVIKFYQHVFEGGYGRWSQELEFLSQLDQFRFYKHFLIPDLIRLGGTDERGIQKDGASIFFKIILGMAEALIVGIGKHNSVNMLHFVGQVKIASWPLDQCLQQLYQVMIDGDWKNAAAKYGKKKINEFTEEHGLPVETFIRVADVLNGTVVEPRGKILLACTRLGQELNSMFSMATKYVKNIEDSAEVFDGLEL